MANRAIVQVEFSNYFQLLRSVYPLLQSMCVMNHDGVVLWDTKSLKSHSSIDIDTIKNDYLNNCNTNAESLSSHALANGGRLYLYRLSNEDDMTGITIVLVMDNANNMINKYKSSMNDLLCAITKNIYNEIELKSALVASEHELNAMAHELTERYEELNLVYQSDNSTLQIQQNQESLRYLVCNCTEFLGVGMTALVIPDKKINIYDFNEDEVIHNQANLIKILASDYYYRLRTHKQTVVINTIQDAINNEITCEIPLKLIITPVQTDEDEVIGMLIIINNNWKSDFTNSDRNLLRVMSKKITKVIHTTYDDLTGLINKHSFEYCLKNTLSKVHAEGFEHALLNIDLDRLSVINDISGLEAGDELLRLLAKTVIKMVRSRDVVARIGGDEIGVLLESCPLETAAIVAKNISNEIDKLSFEWHGEKYDISVCIGVIPITAESESVSLVFGSSEMARNAAKERGVSQVVIYEQNDIDLLRRRDEIKWVTRIQSALRDNRFHLHSQLIQSFKLENNSHYEILLRMIDKKGKLIFPDQFIPAAEHFHLMPELDRWVIKTTIDNLLMKKNDSQPPPCKVSINLSGQSLCDEGFKDYICKHVRRLGEYTNYLGFEITESAAIANLEQACELIDVLKNEGCNIALDDFGTGLSSFSYLQSLDVDFLKIDGAFVKKIVDDPVAMTMVSAINQVGHAMGIRTIAEYAENDLIIAQIKQIGIDYGQGYGLEKPLAFMLLLQDLAPESLSTVAACRNCK